MQNKQAYAPDKSPTQPLVSFIITTYNLPVEMVEECLNSITNLSLAEDEREIILVDDGSEVSLEKHFCSDATECGKTAKHGGGIIYVRQENQGLSMARNHGISLAKGQYIQFVDGDDYLLPSSYNHCLDIVRSKSPDMVLFEMTSNPRSLTLPSSVGEKLRKEKNMTGWEYMLNHNLHGSSCSYVFRSEVLGSLRFTSGILHEDEEFTPLLMLRAGSVIKMAGVAYFYRMRKGSITNKTDSEVHTQKSLRDTEQILYRLQSKLLEYPETGQMALGRRIAQLTMDYLFRVATITHDTGSLNAAIDSLKARGLYPLPKKRYTTKYVLFRMLISSPVGRRALVFMPR